MLDRDKTFNEIAKDAQALVVAAMRPGDVTIDRAVAAALKVYPEGSQPRLEPLLRARAREESDRQCARAGADPRTDRDRLELAFEKLELRGILGRIDFACCQTCGHAEMEDEIDECDCEEYPVRGYTFCHMQDVDRAREGDDLYLAYGAACECETDAGIGHEVVDALRDAGLDAVWDGDVEKRILVRMAWPRRRRRARE